MRFDFLPRSGTRSTGRERERERERGKERERTKLRTFDHVRTWNGAKLLPFPIDFVDTIPNVLTIIDYPDLPQCPRCCLETGNFRQQELVVVVVFVVLVVWFRAQVRFCLARCGLDKAFTVPRNRHPTAPTNYLPCVKCRANHLYSSLNVTAFFLAIRSIFCYNVSFCDTISLWLIR